MKDYIYTLHISDELPDSITLPYIFSITPPITSLSFGARYIACEDIKIHYTFNREIIIGKQIAEKLLLPHSTTIFAFTQNQTIIFGPLIGIFTTGFNADSPTPLGSRSTSLSELLTPPFTLRPFVFAFGVQHINWEEETIEGYFFKEGRWIRNKVPLPNVIYDRLPNREAENYKPIVRAKKRLQGDYAIPWFNPGFFNKWEIHQLLVKEDSIASLLPKTEAFQHFEQVEQLLAHYKHIYMKPIHGSFGRNIHQVFYSKTDNRYYCRYRENGENKLRKYHSLETLLNHVLKGHDLKKFIVQQGISLLRFDGQPVDFRIHTNKNHFGNWRVSAIVAKIAGKGSLTTHVNSGGDTKLLQELFPDSTKQIQIENKLKQTALQISSALDRRVTGNIGEIGFDIGLDIQENPWLFEANSKPGRTVFQDERLKEQSELTRQLFYEYAIYLTEHASRDQKEIILKTKSTSSSITESIPSPMIHTKIQEQKLPPHS
ncbi:YheC/YheD family protein [Bacillus clarus]|uniref:YheC/D like ATP-grasp family protein n=1 Tax=Bacillus clarus TaxID=2338372 RepID=A0A090Z395_9BACI|nr:YheC/YheD family protein [Bacillus clarus]KFN04620.1 yheC/D like ATP-grasp family protein [Bacillus clarus]RFT67893.1 YheC/YheD family protein [Bacillus clarus]